MNKVDPSTTAPRSSKKERALWALLEHPTREQAAAAIGVHPTTLWRWMRQPEFQHRLRAARWQAYSQSVGRLQQAAHLAVETLVQMVGDPEAPAGARIRAAEAVLQQSQKSFELEDVEVRIARLEQVNQEDQGPKRFGARGWKDWTK